MGLPKSALASKLFSGRKEDCVAVPLHQRKRLRLPGLAEVVAVVLAFLTVIPAVVWLRAAAAGTWDITHGTVLAARVHHTHYNAEDTRLKVDCEYEYVVGQAIYRGSWSGFWPDAYGPNALARDELHILRTGFPLMVYYREDNPRVSSPHAPGGGGPVLFAWLFATACVITGYYIFRVYPALRSSRRLRPASPAVIIR
jgi:hypothetical protein